MEIALNCSIKQEIALYLEVVSYDLNRRLGGIEDTLLLSSLNFVCDWFLSLFNGDLLIQQ